MKEKFSPDPEGASSVKKSHVAREATTHKCTLKRLLVATDFSRASYKALEYANALVKTCGAQMHLAHVCDYDCAPGDFEAIPLAIPPAEMTRRSMGRLKDLANKFGIELEADNLHVAAGRAYHEICQLAKELEIDLIVIATRGNTGLRRMALGSTAERVVQYASCPILIVREHEHEAIRTDAQGGPTLELKKILIPLDFSECALAGLEFAVPWAHFWKAQLVLFHSIPPNNFAIYEGFGTQGFPAVDTYVDEAAEGGVRKVATRMLERGLTVATKVEAGPPVARICEYAEREGIDLIITSTHGITGVSHALMGSTAEHIVRYAHCPVLVVPTRNRTER